LKAVAVRPARCELALIEMEAPELGQAGNVRLRVLEVGVCGTDREICGFEFGFPPAGGDALVIGHEALAEVVQVGAVQKLKLGDLVVPMVRRPCRHDHCAACRAGRQDFCLTGDFVERGIRGMHGFMTESVVDEERFLIPVPQALRDVAVLVEPLSIAEKALLQIDAIQRRLPWPSAAQASDRRALVLGAGAVGLLGAMALRLRGFGTVVYSREAATGVQAGLVRSIGAEYASAAEQSLEALAASIGRIDLVYEAVGSAALAFETLKLLGPNGAFVFTGVPGLRHASVPDADAIMRKLVLENQVLLGTVNAGRDAFEGAVRDLAKFVERWPDAVRALITGRYPIERYRELLLGPPNGIKNLISLAGWHYS
jgi:threonine dehydrogenase-like Zn-dependent dehydrogenase